MSAPSPPLTNLTSPNTDSFVYTLGKNRQTVMPVRSNSSQARPQEVIGYAAPEYPDEFFDIELGVVPELFSRVDAEAARVYLSANGVNNFTAGSLTVMKMFENSDAIVSQVIPYNEFNSGNGEVLIHDFGFSDENVKFKVVITTTFTV